MAITVTGLLSIHQLTTTCPASDGIAYMQAGLSRNCARLSSARTDGGERNSSCNTLLYSTLLYSTLLYSTLLYSTLLYSTLLYS
eukprot:COSAG06_NODE_1207_length_10262_cov_14.644396_1_plen_83_part_10